MSVLCVWLGVVWCGGVGSAGQGMRPSWIVAGAVVGGLVGFYVQDKVVERLKEEGVILPPGASVRASHEASIEAKRKAIEKAKKGAAVADQQ